MKYLLLLVFASLGLCACRKEQNRELLGAYFKFKVDGGAEIKIDDGVLQNANDFTCRIIGDTLLILQVEKQRTQAGFNLRDRPLKDTTYILDSIRTGYYVDPAEGIRRTTNNQFKGTLTIRKSTFQAKDLLNTLEGTFSFQAQDTATHTTSTITEGSFLMERKQE